MLIELKWKNRRKKEDSKANSGISNRGSPGGRWVYKVGCDKIGPMNTLVLHIVLNDFVNDARVLEECRFLVRG